MTDTSHFDKCKQIMLLHRKHHRMRFTLLVILLLSSLFFQLLEYSKVFENYVGFHLGMGAITFSVTALVFGLFATPERPTCLAALLAVLVFGAFRFFINFLLTVPLVLVYLLEIPECLKARWVMRQPGYPYFNERFETQSQPYHSTYSLDGRSNAVMQGTDDAALPIQPDKEAAILQMQKRRRQQAEQEADAARKRYDIQLGKTEDAMPEILLHIPEEDAEVPPPLPEETAPVPEAPPADPVTDTSVIVSDFPEITGDIPDLPEIQDIPKL